MPVIGQCKSDPVTGVAGDIYNALTGDADNGLASGATTSGSTLRKLLGAQLGAIATAIVNDAGGSATTLQQAYTAGSAGTWQVITESAANGGIQILAGTNTGALFNVGGIAVPMLLIAANGTMTVYGQINSAVDNNGTIGQPSSKFRATHVYEHVFSASGQTITGANQQIDVGWGTKGQYRVLTLSGNVTSWYLNGLNEVSAAANESTYITLAFKQSGGPFTLSAPSANPSSSETVRFAGASFVLTNAANAVDTVTLVYDPFSNAWREVSRAMNV